MKVPFFLWLFVCCSFILKGQESTQLISPDITTPDIPLAESYSTASIAKFILTNYKTEREKLGAIYGWVTGNIKYDTDSMYVINNEKDSNAKITVALRRQKGVCENFAAIFNDITNKCGIPCYEVCGYTKQYGSIDKTGHTWCVVHSNKQWLFCDPTWDIGLSGHAKYFLVQPSLFIESHMPFDPLWQLLDHTVSHKEFYEGHVFSKKDKPLISFADSLDAYTQMDNLQQLESAAYRVKQAGIANELVRTRLNWIQMQISIIYQEKNMDLYNAAVRYFNNANAILNDFIVYRNEQFIPRKSDQEINKILLPADSLLAASYKKLVEIDSTPDNFQYDPGLLRNRLVIISAKLQEQKDFLKKYLAGTVAERNKLFYK